GERVGYAETSRAIQGGKKSRGVDRLQVLQTQGFNAIQGVGGYVYFATDAGGLVADDRPEILHRTYVYAPAVKRGPNDKSKDKYDLAMRMLDFPNSTAPTALDPQSWALPDVAAYLTFNWKMRQAFDYSETLFDAIMDNKGAFKEMWSAKKSGAESAPVDIYADLLDHVGTRATLLSDVKVPVDLKSERQLVLIELKTPAHTAAVAKTLDKNFSANDRARKLPVQNPVIWEVEQPPQDEPPAKGKAKPKAKAKAPQQQAPPRRTAFTAFLGHLIISTHADYIQEFISRQGQNAGLAKEIDYSRVRTALTALGSKNDSFRYFNRTEESYQANYELFKQGKLPASETLLADLLNALLNSANDKSTRKPEFDGSKLPEFDSIKKYLGPGGLYAQSEDDGWWLVGCLLKKQ